MSERRPSATTFDARGGSSWSTEDECRHLRLLGTYRSRTPEARVPRQVLLQRYLDAMPLRQEWGQIDVGTVRAFCLTQLEEPTPRP